MRNFDQKIDNAAETAKRVVAAVDETWHVAGELAVALTAHAQAAITRVSTKGEGRLTEHISKVAHQLQESAASLANHTEQWADNAAGRSQAAAARRSSQRAGRWLLEPKQE